MGWAVLLSGHREGGRTRPNFLMMQAGIEQSCGAVYKHQAGSKTTWQAQCQGLPGPGLRLEVPSTWLARTGTDHYFLSFPSPSLSLTDWLTWHWVDLTTCNEEIPIWADQSLLTSQSGLGQGYPTSLQSTNQPSREKKTKQIILTIFGRSVWVSTGRWTWHLVFGGLFE